MNAQIDVKAISLAQLEDGTVCSLEFATDRVGFIRHVIDTKGKELSNEEISRKVPWEVWKQLTTDLIGQRRRNS